MARPHPDARDLPDAREILAAGHDMALLRATFIAVFQGQKARGAQPAGMVRYMRKPIAEAAAKPPAGNGHGWEPKPEASPANRAQLRAIERKDKATLHRIHAMLEARDPTADDEGRKYLAEHGEPRAA